MAAIRMLWVLAILLPTVVQAEPETEAEMEELREAIAEVQGITPGAMAIGPVRMAPMLVKMTQWL